MRLSLVEPTPKVDPYWTQDDPKVDMDAFDLVEAPAMNPDGSLRPSYIREVVNVARVVQVSRSGNWAALRDLMGRLDYSFGTNWMQPNPIDTRNTFSPKALASYVNGDSVAAAPINVCNFLLSRGAKRQDYSDMVGVAHFHNGEIAGDGLCGEIGSMVNPTAFYVKWYYKAPRPHRVAMDILNGDIEADDCDREAIEIAVSKEMLAGDFEDFTLIRKTTPNHHGHVAMHATQAGTLPIVAAALFNHRPDSVEAEEIARYAYQLAYGRMNLGVHRPHENNEGLKLGQYRAVKVVPELLAKYANADPDKVARRIEPFVREY